MTRRESWAWFLAWAITLIALAFVRAAKGQVELPTYKTTTSNGVVQTWKLVSTFDGPRTNRVSPRTNIFLSWRQPDGVTWDAVQGAAGYTIIWGTNRDGMTNRQDVGMLTMFEPSNCPPTCTVMVVCRDTNGTESDYSQPLNITAWRQWNVIDVAKSNFKTNTAPKVATLTNQWDVRPVPLPGQLTALMVRGTNPTTGKQSRFVKAMVQ